MKSPIRDLRASEVLIQPSDNRLPIWTKPPVFCPGSQRLSTDGRRKLKRNLMNADHGPFRTCCPPTPQQPSKRVCRNLTAEFCCSETSSSAEPNLDLWVLRTLGLKDRDTIDTSNDSSFSPSVASSSVHNSCQRSEHQTDCRYGPADCHNPAKPPQNHFPATAPTRPIRSYNSSTDVQTQQLTEEPAFSRSPVCSSTTRHPAYWSPLQDRILFSPPGVPFSPTLSSAPVLNQQWMSASGGGPATPAAGSQTPRSRTDVAFSMSLSPSSSVKTHSFPQGQAFVRKDPEGTWHVTWVPRQGP